MIDAKSLAQILSREINEETVGRYCDSSKDVRPATHDRPWTKAIFDTLDRSVVRPRGGRAVYSNPGGNETEFMLDFVWLEESETRCIRRPVMGLESEWSASVDEVIKDFGKLLFFKAPLKVLIYQVPQLAAPERVREAIIRCVKSFAYHVKGESYLFVEFYRTSNRWNQRSFTFLVQHDGAVPDPRLLPTKIDGSEP